MEPKPTPSRPDLLRVGALLFVIVGVEAVVLLQAFGLGSLPLVVHDYQVYHRLGVNLLDHGTFSMEAAPPYRPTIFRSSGYPAFLALVYAVAGRGVVAPRVAQFVLIWLTAWLLFAIGVRFAGRRAALVAAVVCATYPAFVFMAPLYATHCHTLFLTALAVLGVTTYDDGSRFRALHLGSVGVCLGALTLVSAAFQLLPAFFAAGLLLGQPKAVVRRRLGPVAMLLLGFGLVIAPWVVRNNRVSGGASGVKLMVGGWGLYHSAQQYLGEISYQTPKKDWDRSIGHFNRRLQDATRAVPDGEPYAVPRRELLASRLLTADAVAGFRRLTVGRVLASLPFRLYWLWSTSDVSPWQTPGFAFHRFAQLYHLSVMALIVLGVYTARHRLPEFWPLWVLAAYQTLLHLVFHVEARYTLEGRLFLLVFAGVGLCSLPRLLRGRPPVAAGAAAPGAFAR